MVSLYAVIDECCPSTSL